VASDLLSPTFCLHDDDDSGGTLKVWSGVLQGEFSVNKIHTQIPFKRHCIHGNIDRDIWEQKEGEIPPAILGRIAQRLKTFVGEHLADCENYANYYADEMSHTFTHRDLNCNPDEFVTLVSFGATRRLAFCDCRRPNEYIVIPLTDGSIVQFDGRFNTVHYHKVLKQNEAAGPRISIQWYRPRDNAKWSPAMLDLWDANDTSKSHVKTLKRRIKKDLESNDTDCYGYIPPQFKVYSRGSTGSW